MTFLGNQESSRSLYAIPGLDYVAHEDIIPYTSAEKTPLQHELFDKFLVYNTEKDPPYVAQETLRAWQNKNHPWLELSDVHKETTENIRVTVIPFYMGCRESHTNSVYWVIHTSISLSDQGPYLFFSLSSGATASDWRIWVPWRCSCENATGGYFRCRARWRLSGAEEWWDKSRP